MAGLSETAVSQPKVKTTRKRWPVALALLLGAALTLAALPFLPTPLDVIATPITAVDLSQHRLNAVPPPPDGSFTLQQTITPQRDGFYQIELLAARQGDPQADGNGRFTLTLTDSSGSLVATKTLDTGAVSHNQPLTLTFPPQPNSAGRPYRLTLSGTPENDLSVWGYDLDVYDRGALAPVADPVAVTEPQTAVQELRFITRYRLSWPQALRRLGHTVGQQGGTLLLMLLLLPLPGCLVLLLGQRRWPKLDRAAWWGTAVALGASLWPLLWFGLSQLGGRWTAVSLWAFFVAGWGVAIGLWLWRRQTYGRPLRLQFGSLGSAHLLLLAILVVGLALRLLAVRDVTFPLWVDASRHGLITAVMAENGRVITDYAPFLPIDRFPYHFGFHTIAAGLTMMRGESLTALLLYGGQLLNALTPLAVYAAAWLFTRRRDAGVLAAFLVAIPFFFPAYYATWGRFTQLTGMLVLPVLAGVTWRLVHGARRWRGGWWLVGILAAGLFLLHFRVFLIYLPFAVVAWGMSWGRNGRWLAAAAVLTTLLVGLRAVQLAEMNDNLGATVSYTIPGYNAFPVSYYQSGWERYFVWLAGALLLPVLVEGVRRRRWTAVPLALTAWVGLLFLLLSGESLGLPETTLINLNSMYITLFAPQAIFLGVVLMWLWRRLRRGPLTLHAAAALLAGVGLTAVSLFGMQQQITILNPQTILARPEDEAGLAWIAANTPPNARFAVSSWLWLGNTYAASDGGAWIVPLTGRHSTTPPADYIYNQALWQQVNAFNERATAVEDWSAWETAAWLRQQGVTHLFVGSKGGFLDPAALTRNPEIVPVFRQDGVFIFELLGNESR